MGPIHIPGITDTVHRTTRRLSDGTEAIAETTPIPVSEWSTGIDRIPEPLWMEGFMRRQMRWPGGRPNVTLSQVIDSSVKIVVPSSDEIKEVTGLPPSPRQLTFERAASALVLQIPYRGYINFPMDPTYFHFTATYLMEFYAIARQRFTTYNTNPEGFWKRMVENADELMTSNYGSRYSDIARFHLGIANRIVNEQWTQAKVWENIDRLKRVLARKNTWYLNEWNAALAFPEVPLPPQEYDDEYFPLATKEGKAAVMNAVRYHHLRMVLEVLRSYVEDIPRIVHFIKTDASPDSLQLIHYICIMSAIKKIKPVRVYLHTPVPPEGVWWEKLKHHVTLRIIPVPVRVAGKPASLAAHQSDMVRLTVLKEMGGLYLDWDVVSWRSFDDLFKSGYPTILGVERKSPSFKESIGVAVMMARPDSMYIDALINATPQKFEGRSCYTCHSLVLNNQLAKEKPSIVKILNSTAFYFPGWQKDHTDKLFSKSYYDKDMAKRVQDRIARRMKGAPVDDDYLGVLQALYGPHHRMDVGYAAHLFESHENVVDHVHALNEHFIKTTETNFNSLVKEYV